MNAAPLDTEEAEPVAGPIRIVVAIATTGRPGILGRTVRMLGEQTRRPDRVLICVPGAADAGDLAAADLPFVARVLTAPRGAAAQRNRAIEAARPGEVLLFLDDDFLLAPDYVDALARLFETRPDIVMATGRVLADGVSGPGFDFDTGRRLLSEGLAARPRAALVQVANGYGCNLAVRADPLLAHGIRFDERLPLYSWLEDVDFSARVAPHGAIVRAERLRGVHLGTKTGRTPGGQVGYSQVANPLYLHRKGTLGRKRMLRLMARNLASNLRGTLRPRPWIDYRGRLRGNLRALWDVLRGRAAPERALDIRR